MEDRDAIDLSQIMQLFRKYKIRLIAIISTCTLIALAVAFMLPKEYESTTLVRAKNSKQGGISLQAASALAVLGGGGVPSPTQAYIELMKSRNVLEPVIANLDLPEEKRGKIEAKNFARTNLKIQNTKGTDLIEVTAIGRSPEEAQKISSEVVQNFQQMMTKLNQSEQSIMIKFLKERIDIAKKEMEQAEQKMENFRQQEKIYVPDQQAKALIDKLTDFDKKITEMQVQNDTNQVRIKEINEQLQKQNAAISQYNIADNPTIQKMRDTIIQKQMDLVELQQRYTDKHPNVVVLKKEITALNLKLNNEVEQSIASGANTLNPIHAGLLKEKVQTETQILVGQAALGTAKKLQTQNEIEISKLSAGSVTYIGLERQVKIAQEVYSVLVKNYEQTRIQETMDSMDIQIVDNADLPKKESAPKKMTIVAIGSAIGIIISIAYVIMVYTLSGKKSHRLLS